MRVFKIKFVKQLLGLSRKDIKQVLLHHGIIHKSWAVINAKGLVVELYAIDGTVAETTLLITEAGIDFLREEVCYAV